LIEPSCAVGSEADRFANFRDQRRAFLRFQNWPMVFVASSSHSRFANSATSPTALKNFTAFGLVSAKFQPVYAIKIKPCAESECGHKSKVRRVPPCPKQIVQNKKPNQGRRGSRPCRIPCPRLDTAPDSTGLAERRSPIRRGSEIFATPAGSETGAPGAGSGAPAVSPLRPGIDARNFPAHTPRMGTLYYGDNLDILRRYLKDENEMKL